MPARLWVKFEKPADVTQRDFNNMVRDAYTAAGLFWVVNFAPKHFEPGAMQRYQLPKRTAKYERRRDAMARKRGEQPAPLVFTGLARGIARMRAGNPGLARVLARATSNRQYVQVPIPLGHAVPEKNVEDFGKLTNDEMREMTRIARESLAESLRLHSLRKITVKIGDSA